MKNKIDSDFEKFNNTETQNYHLKSDDIILSFVKNDLEPQHKTIVLKILIVQTFIGMITLLFCPQFNFSLTNNFEVFHFFHRNFGHTICTAICASIFIGSGTIFASMLLSISELKEIIKTKGLYGIGLSGYFVSLFLLIGSEVYLMSSIIWAMSAILTFTTISYGALKVRYSQLGL